MNQLLIKPAVNHQWTEAIKARWQNSDIEEVLTFPMRTVKGANDKLSDYLTTRIAEQYKRVSETKQKTIECLSANLTRIALCTGLTGFCFSMNNRSKAIPKRFKREPYSNKTMVRTIHELAQADWLHLEKGFKAEHHTHGLSSLILPTQKLKETVETLRDQVLLDISRDTDPLELRSAKGQHIDYPDDTKTTSLRRDIQTHNQLRTGAVWLLQGKPLHSNDLVCRRIFKGDWQTGGRLYCAAQNLPKADRRLLKVDGEQVTELDFKSLHPRLLYQSVGKTAPEDCYAIEGIERKLVKKIALIATSTSCKRKAIQAVTYRCRLAHHDAVRLLDLFERKHSSIKHLLYCSSWQWLQYQDSEIAHHVLHLLAASNTPVLPIHDSFIVPSSQAERLQNAMQSAYEACTGAKPEISKT